MKKLTIIFAFLIAGFISVSAQQSASLANTKAPSSRLETNQPASDSKPAVKDGSQLQSCHGGNGKACCQKGGASCGHGGEGHVNVQSGESKVAMKKVQ